MATFNIEDGIDIIHGGTTIIRASAFKDCTPTPPECVVIPIGITKIGKSAFEGCTSLECVVIPIGVTEIGESTFKNCTSLTTVILSSFSVNKIGNDTFDGCKKLAKIYVPANLVDHYKGLLSVDLRGKIAPAGDINWDDAICKVLADNNGEPMHSTKILKKIIEQGYRGDFKKTPGGSINGILSTCVNEGRIKRERRGFYKLVGTPVIAHHSHVDQVAPIVVSPCSLYRPSDSKYKKASDFIDSSVLSEEEKELLELIVNFHLPLGGEKVCFADKLNNLEVEISEEEKRRPQLIDKALLETKLNELKKQIYNNNNMCGDLYIDLRMRMSSFIEMAGNLLGIFDEKVEFEYRLLGEFIPPKKREDNPKIIIYYKNIRDSYGEKSCYVMPAVFVHEIFHAWNYFNAREKTGSVLAIDEPMVEFASLYFLKELEAFTPSESHFLYDKVHGKVSKVRCEGESLVKNKQLSIGDEAAYGFGYYLFKELGERKGDSRNWIETYSKKSASIDNSSDELVEKVEDALIPIYPFMSEKDVMEWFEKIIFGGKAISVTAQKSAVAKVGLDVSLRDLVLACIKTIGRKCFDAQELYKFAPIFEVCVPHCENLEVALKQQLDDLVNDGILEALLDDCYRMK